MKLRIAGIGIAVAVGLTGCGGSGANVPDQFVGTWAADCTSPYVRFNTDGTMHVYPDNADYTLKSAVTEGSTLKVSYVSVSGEMTDVYVSEGSTLRLTKTIAGGQEADWTKAPMSKCP